MNWKGAPPKGDAADYFAAGGTMEGLARLVVAPGTDQDSDESEDESQHTPPRDGVARFPLEALPQTLRTFVEQGAKAIGCPEDYLAVPLLVYAGNAIGNARCLRIKRTWHEGPRAWVAIIGLPGDKKSPALELAYRPFERQQRKLEAEWRQAHQAWSAQSPEERQGIPEPKMQQVATTDATLEALGDLLAANERGMLFQQDELTGWALAMNQYKGGKGADRKHWLSFWNGAGAIINRRNRSHAIVLHSPFVGVVGGLQPDMLGELSDERGRQDGFIHRILFAYPDPAPLTWSWDDVEDEIVNAYCAVFTKLWELQPVTDEQGAAQPQAVDFTPSGKRAWEEWISDHYREVNGPGFPDNLRGPWAKLVSYAARFALTLHQCRRADGETDERGVALGEDVDEVSVAGAGDVVDYFKSHARRAYQSLSATPEDKQVLTAVKWIARQPGRKTTTRDLQHAWVSGTSTKGEALHLIGQLVERGYGSSRETNVRGGTRVEFILTWHPTQDR